MEDPAVEISLFMSACFVCFYFMRTTVFLPYIVYVFQIFFIGQYRILKALSIHMTRTRHGCSLLVQSEITTNGLKCNILKYLNPYLLKLHPWGYNDRPCEPHGVHL